MLALERDLEGRSARLIAIELCEAPWIEDEGAWHDGLAERGTARRRIEKARDLKKGAYLDLVTGRAKPWRTARVSPARVSPARVSPARVSGDRIGRKARATTPPLDPGWLRDPRDDRHEAVAEDGRGYVDTKGASDYVGLSVRTLRRMRKERRGPAYVRKGRRVLYDLRALDAWMEEDG